MKRFSQWKVWHFVDFFFFFFVKKLDVLICNCISSFLIVIYNYGRVILAPLKSVFSSFRCILFFQGAAIFDFFQGTFLNLYMYAMFRVGVYWFQKHICIFIYLNIKRPRGKIMLKLEFFYAPPFHETFFEYRIDVIHKHNRTRTLTSSKSSLSLCPPPPSVGRPWQKIILFKIS